MKCAGSRVSGVGCRLYDVGLGVVPRIFAPRSLLPSLSVYVYPLSLARSRLVARDAGEDSEGTPVQGHLELKKTRFTVHAGHYPGTYGWGNTCILALSLARSRSRG